MPGFDWVGLTAEGDKKMEVSDLQLSPADLDIVAESIQVSSTKCDDHYCPLKYCGQGYSS